MKNSFINSGLRNYFMVFGWFTEFSVCLLLCYVLPVGKVFNTRDLILPHFMLPAVIPCLFVFVFEEIRKWLIRHWPKDSVKYPSWFERNLMV